MKKKSFFVGRLRTKGTQVIFESGRPKPRHRQLVFRKKLAANRLVEMPIKYVQALVRRSIFTETLLLKLTEAILTGDKVIRLTPREHIEVLSKQREFAVRSFEWRMLTHLKKEAFHTELEGNLKEAIELYKLIIELSVKSKSIVLNDFSYAIVRLRLLSKKLGVQEEFEEFILSMGLSHFLEK